MPRKVLVALLLCNAATTVEAIIGADGQVHEYRRPAHHPKIRMLNSRALDDEFEEQLITTGSVPEQLKSLSEGETPDFVKMGKDALGGKSKNVIDGINLMRAEICSKMIGKHERSFKAFEQCKKFMRNVCHPGRDEQMNGDGHKNKNGNFEASTGLGFCEAFFPALKPEAEKEVEKEEEEEEEVKEEKVEAKHESSYEESAGKILGKPIEGHAEKMSAHDAEQLCEELGDECAGYTCDKDGKKCTVRAPGTLKDSTHGEVSFVKPSFDPKSFEEKADEGDDTSDWDKQEGKMLGEPIPGETTERGVGASQRACEELGDKCAGFTCDKDERVCTLRGPGNLVSTDNGEVSYIKPGLPRSQGGGKDGDGTIFHMDESKGLPDQGFYGPDVMHDDQQTFTGDWQKEFGPKQRGEKNVKQICEEHKAETGKENKWCKLHGMYQSGASQQGSASLLCILAVSLLMSLMQ